MAYEPPSGWIEILNDPSDEDSDYLEKRRFHARQDCSRVRGQKQMISVDRPYSANRCPSCAPM